ncbi:biopolymer transporter ExbD [Mucilaginibacter galii]|uniref:Biopolymer transporter ExbD n=2 Tax=Mucilaginibacter galii TaxID=2005073 RepID=A0A917J9L7_9SPHI|nr:biopolymer transporter ExbD [Mucilaginibacter galii]
MLSAKFKDINSPIQVTTPATKYSMIVCSMHDNNVAVILIRDNKVFLQLNDVALRKQTLLNMALKRKINFNEAELSKFSLIGNFGSPMHQLKSFISQYNNRTHVNLQGIPIDTTANNEFYHWIQEARKAFYLQHRAELHFAIEGEQKQSYPTIKLVIDNLQKQDINKFELVTRSANQAGL